MECSESAPVTIERLLETMLRRKDPGGDALNGCARLLMQYQKLPKHSIVKNEARPHPVAR